MAKTITKDLSPSDVAEVANDYIAKLKATGLAYKEDKILADVEKRVAELNGKTVEDWKASFSPEIVASEPEAAPEKKAARAAKEPSVAERVKRVKEQAASVDGTYFYMKPEELQVTETWMKLRIDGGIVQNMLVVGPSGSGKTESLKRLAQKNGIPAYKIDCASITTTDKWVGQKNIEVVDGASRTTYTLSEHLRWLGAIDCPPGLVIYDEITRLHPSLLNILIPILDGSQELWVPDLGIYAKVHPETIIAATANIGAQFAGTYGLDQALHDRFAVIQERTFPPKAEEIKVLERRTGIDTKQATTLVEIGEQVRQKHDQNLIDKPVSTRALIDAGYWVAAGMNITDACETTWVKKYSEEGKGNSQRMMVRLILQGKAGGK